MVLVLDLLPLFFVQRCEFLVAEPATVQLSCSEISLQLTWSCTGCHALSI